MLTSSSRQLPRIRTVRNYASVIVLSLLCVAWNAFHARFATHTSTKATSHPNAQSSAEKLFDFTRPRYDSAAKHLHHKLQRLKTQWAPDSKTDARQSNAERHPFQGYTTAEYEAQQSLAHDQNNIDPSNSLSRKARNSLKFACESAQDVWLMLNPSIHSFTKPNENAELDPDAVDDALEHIRGVMHILRRTQNALLERKYANLPLFQKLWMKALYYYKDPYFAENRGVQSAKFRKALSELARSVVKYDNVFRNSDDVKEQVNGAVRSFAKEVRHSLSTLKRSLQKATNHAWLMASNSHPYVKKAAHSFKALSEKCLNKIANLAEAIRLISGKLQSTRRRKQLLKEFEDMMTELKEEVWRAHTEWIYQRGEALSWAEDRFHDLKRRAALESRRAYQNLGVYAHTAKQVLNESSTRCQKSLVILRVGLSKLTKRLINTLHFFIYAVTSLYVSCCDLLVLFISTYWRIFALIAVVIFFRFLLGFLLADEYFRTVLARTFPRPDVNESGNQRLETTADRQSGTSPAGSPNKSETSESGPARKYPASERKGPTDIPKPSRLRGSTPPEQNKAIKTRVQRRERRTVPKSGNDRTQKQTTPLQVSNLHHQNMLTSLEKQMNGRPIRLGDHEVQLVYEDSPRSDSPRSDAADAQGKDVVRKRTSTPAKTAGPQRASRQGENKTTSNQETEHSDDVIIINSGDESSTNYGSATSRLSRASRRRAAARRNQAR